MISNIRFENGRLYIEDEDGTVKEFSSAKDFCTPELASPYGEPFEWILDKEKEGKSMDILDIYKRKSVENIKNYYDEEIEKKRNEIEVVKEVKHVTDKFEQEVKKLIDKYGDAIYFDEDYFEDCFTVDAEDTEEIEDLLYRKDECFDELTDKLDEIKAHLELLPPVNETTYDAVMPIFKTYGVVDEEGKITPYTPNK